VSSGTLSDKSVRNALGPLAACLASARREEMIRDNPVTDAALPQSPADSRGRGAAAAVPENRRLRDIEAVHSLTRQY
jgi:hypothetical protein